MGSRRPLKRPLIEYLDRDDSVQQVYRFQILLPNGTSTRVILRDPGEEILLDEFIWAIRREVEKSEKSESKRKIRWNEDLYLEDMSENRIKKKIYLSHFKTNKWHMLRLHDGVGESVDTFQNMWDLTPDTDLLAELPAEYTFETALADLIDNSLQAVWSNCTGERKLVRVTVDKNEILILDSGPGMDGSDENCIVKWGKMGSSNHRASRELGVGGKPPYLMPSFGMYGYGGVMASMHLGRQVIVSSKRKDSRKVYILHLAREGLLNKSNSKSLDYIWRTDGGIRHPLEEEVQMSPHGSFTKVHIHEPKVTSLDTFKLQCLLKDIYFPYIQCDEEACTRKTTMPVEFQVNGIDLAEIDGGEISVTNLHSCNGPDFTFELRFSTSQVGESSKSSGSNYSRRAHARLRCVYLPIVKGKENIDRILDKLDADGCRITEDFENFCRVSIRRNGRLLPDARWRRLYFMEPKLRKGDKAQILKRCSLRVKCFVETDAGFSPTPSKTELQHHDPFTVALKNFGDKAREKETDAIVEIFKDEKPVNIVQLERLYQEWTLQMHDQYDEEIDGGEDEPVLVVCPSNKKRLGISSDVVRVHQVIRRKGSSWRSGMKVKILKGAVGFLKSNLYATLEYILLEGFEGDAGGEARLICRPLSSADNRGCLLSVRDGTSCLEIRDSISLPISVIDSGKCQVIATETWNFQLGRKQEKRPSRIDILSGKQCQLLGIGGELLVEAPIIAGCVPPSDIVAVIRPANFVASCSSVTLDQKYIIKADIEMTLRVTRSHDENGDSVGEQSITEATKPLSHGAFDGLYLFPLGRKYPRLFHRAGVYVFHLSVTYGDENPIFRMVKVTVRPSSTIGKCTFSFDKNGCVTGKTPFIVRVGSNMSYLSVALYDSYSNQLSFSSIPEIDVEIHSNGCTLIKVDKMKASLSPDRKLVEIMDIPIQSSKLDMIRPHYEALFKICLRNESFCRSAPCKVLPGSLHSIALLSSSMFGKCLTPGYVVEELLFEACDAYGNHVEEGIQVHVEIDGLCLLDHVGPIRKVDNRGYIDLSHILKVEAGYGASVRLTIYYNSKMLFEKRFPVEKRELRAVSGVPGTCDAGSFLENIVFGVFDPNGVVDESIHGPYHTLVITLDSMNLDNAVQYSFQHGRCTVPSIPVPWEKGIFHFSASHTHHCELCTSVEVYVVEGPKLKSVGAEDPEVNILHSQLPANGSFLLDSSPHNPVLVDTLADSVIHITTKLYDDFAEAAERVGSHERKLKELEVQRTWIANDIDDLQADLEPCLLHQVGCLSNTKEQIVKCIEARKGTAAAVFCSLSKGVQFLEPQVLFMEEVVGVVALLGSVGDEKLSRVFAEYLGENYMLAVVFKSYKSAAYGEDGKVNRNCAIHKITSLLGTTIDKQFTAVCLDEIRPYSHVLGSGSERKLALPCPCLPSGKMPHGFKGYAVNMINLDIDALRETLFYRLFGELQVYETWEDIEQAKACIKTGAVSLDGGIMRGHGIICLGDCDPDIKFPVCEAVGLSVDTKEVLKRIEKKKFEMARIEDSIAKETAAHSKALDKFRKRSQRLTNFVPDKKLGLAEYKSL